MEFKLGERVIFVRLKWNRAVEKEIPATVIKVNPREYIIQFETGQTKRIHKTSTRLRKLHA